MKKFSIFVILILCILLAICLPFVGFYKSLNKATIDINSILEPPVEDTAVQIEKRAFDRLVQTQSSMDELYYYGYELNASDIELLSSIYYVNEDKYDSFRLMKKLGYKISTLPFYKAENYAEAKDLVRDGKYIEAIERFNIYPDYLYSAFICDKIIRQGLVSFRIGDRGPAGGWIFYDKGSYSGGWRYLEAAPEDLPGRYYWGKNVNLRTSTAIGLGKSNTEKIVVFNMEYTAATACEAYVYHGYDDWFLPSVEELNHIYENLKTKRIGKFEDVYYWSSSEGGKDDAFSLYFKNGGPYYSDRDKKYYVRPVRAF